MEYLIDIIRYTVTFINNWSFIPNLNMHIKTQIIKQYKQSVATPTRSKYAYQGADFWVIQIILFTPTDRHILCPILHHGRLQRGPLLEMNRSLDV